MKKAEPICATPAIDEWIRMTDTRRHAAGLTVHSWADLGTRKWPAREFVMEPWLRQGESCMLWAKVGLGKSMLALTQAAAVAGGGSVCGWTAPKPRPVLYIDGEMFVQDVYNRLEMLLPTIEGVDQDLARRNLKILSRTDQTADAKFPDLAFEHGQDDVFKLAEDVHAGWVILDNFSTLASIPDENEASAMTPVLGFLLRAKQAGLTTCLVHHSTKDGNNFRGSTKLATTFEVIIGLRELDGRTVSDGAGFELRWDKFRGAPTAATRDMTLDLELTPEGRRKWAVKPAPRAEVDAMLELLLSGLFRTNKQIAASLGWNESKMSRMRTQAIMKGLITPQAWNASLKADDYGNDF